jgi:hypothetical protein
MTRLKNWLRRFLYSIFDDEVVGAVEYIFGNRDLVGEPFNGQHSRHDLFQSLVERFAPLAIVETGTFCGSSTEFMIETGLPFFPSIVNRAGMASRSRELGSGASVIFISCARTVGRRSGCCLTGDFDRHATLTSLSI